MPSHCIDYCYCVCPNIQTHTHTDTDIKYTKHHFNK